MNKKKNFAKKFNAKKEIINDRDKIIIIVRNRIKVLERKIGRKN
jgi:hypothetical protein